MQFNNMMPTHQSVNRDEFNLHVNEISFLYEKIGPRTHFKKEAKHNLEMVHRM